MASSSRPAVLLTCDVRGLSRSCALHRLRWKSVGREEPLSSKDGHKSREAEGDEEQQASSKEHKEEEEEEDPCCGGEPSSSRGMGPGGERGEVVSPERLVLSIEPSGELRPDTILSRQGSGLFLSPGDSPRLKRSRSDESVETARSKDDDGPSVGLEQYSALVASGGPRASPPPAPTVGLMMRRNSSGTSSTGEAGGEWGFYEDCDSFFSRESASRLDVAAEMSAADRVTPEYVLEDSLASQALWHSTAGKRPPQPLAERKKFEALWAKNFEESQVDYSALERAADAHRPAWARALTAETPHVVPLLREQSPFGTSATKSWECPTCGELSSMMVHIPKYQVVKEGSFDIHAEYLVVVRLRFVTFGLWRRYKDFQRLADKIVKENRPIDFENTLGSWRCVKRRQKWFRCLDKDYITLKCFLLERFLHDAVFESTSSDLFLDFLEIQIQSDDDDDDNNNNNNMDTRQAGGNTQDQDQRGQRHTLTSAAAASSSSSHTSSQPAHQPIRGTHQPPSHRASSGGGRPPRGAAPHPGTRSLYHDVAARPADDRQQLHHRVHHRHHHAATMPPSLAAGGPAPSD